MRIGLVCPYSCSHPGGVQSHVWGLGEYLAGRGHAVSILAPGLPPAQAAAARPQPGFVSAGGAVPVPWNGSTARISYSPRTAGVVGRWLADGRFDVVHVHEPVTPSIAWQALGRAHVPVLATAHAARRDARLHAAAARWWAGRVRRLGDAVAVSGPAADLAAAYLGRRPDIVPNGLWLADFRLPRPAAARPVVAFLGRDEPRKGLPVLLAAAPALADLGADVVVAGEPRGPLPRAVRSVRVRDAAARARLLASTAVFVAPATGAESFGLVLVEAAAAGAQVVASDLPGFREAVGDAAHWFAPGDPAGLAAAVRRALADPIPAERLAARVARYDWPVVGAALEARYAALLA